MPIPKKEDAPKVFNQHVKDCRCCQSAVIDFVAYYMWSYRYLCAWGRMLFTMYRDEEDPNAKRT